ncbi:tRNA1(Val) (adenine(37)-N6)-methyltransferase [Pseudoroseicyclus tamaricis]|uniref:Methyltransferase n=1 Tax=Pseudoroseicyclus tamaricis TaxID=2705421 RepID=A0A6B2JVG0_9RHOB|nr:methyltransferase [Pseudoroseicyclus tamaricis]NDV02070.1 methyltransferase [Pseudoroseicyclus tamaricis]
MASSSEPPTTRDAFLGGRLMLRQPAQGYRAGTDPVLLAAAVPAEAGQSVLDLGCGVGTALFCLGVRVPGLHLAGLELQAAYAALARDNAAQNGLEAQIHEGDLAAMPAELKARNFSHVIANPPFFAAGRGKSPEDPGRATGRREEAPLAEWVTEGARRLAPGGHLTMILRAERLAELLVAASGRLGSPVVQPLTSREGRAAERVIVRLRKGGRGGLKLLAPVILHAGPKHEQDRDSFTNEVAAVLRDAAPLHGMA